MPSLSYDEAIERQPDLADEPEAQVTALLAAAYELILEWLGPGSPTYEEPTAVNELISARGELFRLSQPASEILTLKEAGTTRAADTFELRSDGRTVRRVGTGTWPYIRGWRGGIDVTYVPLEDTARREVAQLALVRLFLDFNPGVVSERIGEWSETFAQGNAAYRESLDSIRSTLMPVAAGIY